MERDLSHYLIQYMSNILGVIICVPLGFGGSYLLFWMATAAHENDRLYHPLVLVGFSTVLVLTLLSFAGGYRAISKMREAEADLDSASVDTDAEPWLLDKEWRERAITGYTDAPGRIGPAIKWLALFFLFVLPVGIVLAASILGVMRDGLDAQNGTFLLIGLVIAIGFVYQLARSRKFGRSTCHLKTLPVWIGQYIEADVRIEFPGLKRAYPDGPDEDVETVLQCCDASSPNALGGRVVEEYRNDVPKHSVIASGDGTLVIPVHMDVPESAEEKTRSLWSRTYWRLKVKTKFGGMTYQYHFNVPVVSAGQHGAGTAPDTPAALGLED